MMRHHTPWDHVLRSKGRGKHIREWCMAWEHFVETWRGVCLHSPSPCVLCVTRFSPWSTKLQKYWSISSTSAFTWTSVMRAVYVRRCSICLVSNNACISTSTWYSRIHCSVVIVIVSVYEDAAGTVTKLLVLFIGYQRINTATTNNKIHQHISTYQHLIINTLTTHEHNNKWSIHQHINTSSNHGHINTRTQGQHANAGSPLRLRLRNCTLSLCRRGT